MEIMLRQDRYVSASMMGAAALKKGLGAIPQLHTQ